MERILKAQRLAAIDVERGVTLDMVKKNRDAHKLGRIGKEATEDNDSSPMHKIQHRGHVQRVSEDANARATASELIRSEAIEKLLATIDETEKFEDQLRAKYNL
jgi:hypothetical protein